MKSWSTDMIMHSNRGHYVGSFHLFSSHLVSVSRRDSQREREEEEKEKRRVGNMKEVSK